MFSAAFDVGANVCASGCASQVMTRFQRVEQLLTVLGVQPPQALDLALGKIQTRHFGVFGSNELEPVVEISAANGLLRS